MPCRVLDRSSPYYRVLSRFSLCGSLPSGLLATFFNNLLQPVANVFSRLVLAI
jgi:hypothetical protein